MILNTAEFWLMNNPLRTFILNFEAKRMRSMTDYNGGDILEIGCGQGKGTKLIKRMFVPESIEAIDLDPKMIERAKSNINMEEVNFKVADVTDLPYSENQFDAIFDFGILHHVPNWKDAIKELKRVLKPGGKIILEDLSIESFHVPVLGWILRRTLEHPYDKMFKRDELFSSFEENGFRVLSKKQNIFWFNLILEKEYEKL